MEQYLQNLLLNYNQYAYLILFLWCILEGELALIFAGILAHQGHINLSFAVLCCGFGGFIGDQIYFYIGRYNKKTISKKMHSQRRKFAVAHLLLKKYGWPIIFIQRYIYGFRTVIPMSIGIVRYDAKKFAIINFISAICWAIVTIIPAWYFGDVILKIFSLIEKYWYFALPIIILFFYIIIRFIKNIETSILKQREDRRGANRHIRQRDR